MGVKLVGQTYLAHWSILTDREARILGFMAYTALDNPRGNQEAAIYWGGYEPIMLALFGEIPERGTPARRTAEKKIQTAIRRLVDTGAIERLAYGHRGHADGGSANSRYRITLNTLQPSLLDDPDERRTA